MDEIQREHKNESTEEPESKGVIRQSVDSIVTISDIVSEEETSGDSGRSIPLEDLTSIKKETLELLKQCCIPHDESEDPIFEAVPLSSLIQCDVEIKIDFDPSNIFDEVLRMIANRELTDCVVIIGDDRFNCHMVVLIIYAKYFRDFLKSKEITLNEENVPIIGFTKAYEWMCSSDAAPDRENIVELYMAAKFLDIPELMKQIWSRLDSEEYVDSATAFEIYLEALELHADEINELMLSRFGPFFLIAASTLEFLQLPIHAVIVILDSNNLHVNSEMDIFFVGLRWILYDWNNRKQYSLRVMKTVRFKIISLGYLTSITTILPNEMKELLDLPELDIMIKEAMAHTLTKEYIGVDPVQNQPFGLDHIAGRIWIVDPLCSHHHIPECSNFVRLDYESFTDYVLDLEGRELKPAEIFQSGKPEEILDCCKDVTDKHKSEIVVSGK